jgi:arabinonate dehydratase
MTTLSLQTLPATRLDPADDVAIALRPLRAGQTITVAGQRVTLQAPIPPGHKFALHAVAVGEPVRRYGQIIGTATTPIAPGEHVHTQNLHVAALQLDYAVGADAQPVAFAPEAEHATFLGYRRADGRVGTRNIIAVATTVNCSAHTARRIAARARAELLPRFPHVDNVVALTHGAGCGTRAGSAELDVLQATIAGHVRHPNVAGAVIVGLGCEANQFADLIARQSLDDSAPRFLGIQDEGGVAATVAQGLAALEPLLVAADQVRRERVPASELVLALQCGGSDGFSGITANPALGLAADWLVAQGGTVVLAETPEIYGAEHLLTRRAAAPEVAAQLLERIRWWEHYAAMHGFELDNNPTPGNKAGGLTTIHEKSLGAVAKAGSTPLNGVYRYAERIDRRGFVFMDTPGYDPVSVTGQVAGGCNLVAFTTGRGSCFGCAVAPSIKIATNSVTYERMRDDMDVNAGVVLDGVPLATVAREIADLLLAVASGQASKSEAQGIGEEEFDPWILGATL